MASLKFPDTGTRYVELSNGKPAINQVGYLYQDAALTVVAEAYADNSGVKGALLPTDENGRRYIRTDGYARQVDYWGPASGQDSLWIVINGVANRVDADYDARLDALGTRVTAIESSGASTGDITAEASTRAAADTTLSGLITAEASSRVSGDSAAQAAAQAFAVQRANHTGTQAVSTVTGLQTALDGKVAKGAIWIDPRDAPYNADPTGVADATAAVTAAFTAANALARPGLNSSIVEPGATVVLQGIFNLATLTTPIEMRCNVESNGATFIAPAGYAGVAVLAGHSTSGVTLQTAKMNLPDVMKPTSSAQVAGSVGIRLQNLFNSQVSLGRTAYFDTGLHLTGDQSGTSYCKIYIGWISYCKVALSLKPHTAGGYANQNAFTSGGIQQSTGYAGGNKISGWRHLVMDGNSINNVTGNAFYNVSFEGDVSEYVFELRGAYDNVWHGCRHEQGVAGVACTVSGGATSTITKTAHGLSVGDMLTFSASVTPTGMYLISPYYVVSTPTADTFTVSAQKGGTAVTFATTGTSVIYFRPQRILLDAQTQTVGKNTISYPMTPLGALDVVTLGAQYSNNNIQWADRQFMDSFTDNDTPLYRARNRSGTATSRPAFAAYDTATNPNEDPYNWLTAIGDRGLLFATSRAEQGRIFQASASAGVISYKRPVDTASFEIASCRRTPGLISSITGLSVPANSTTTATFTLTDASVNDHVLVTPVSGVTAGVIFSHAFCNSANTITVVFGNLTAAPIVISPVLQAVAFRRFF